MTIPLSELHGKWMKEPGYRREYEAMQNEPQEDGEVDERAVDALAEMVERGLDNDLKVTIHQNPATMIEVAYWTTDVERGKAALQTLIDFNRRGGKTK